MSDFFQSYRRNVQVLLAEIPAIHAALDRVESLKDFPGWPELNLRPRQFVERDGLPVLVATLLGPTGAGKSTLFCLLTGIDVPIGAVRPVTRQCAVAVPAPLANEGALRALFPGCRILPLENPRQLQHQTDTPTPNASDQEKEMPLYFKAYSSREEIEVKLVLADVPDFNSVEQANWARVAIMLSRAEVVVFVSYSESYKDKSTVDHLLGACRHAGHLIYVLNKTPNHGASAAQVAADIRDDLLRYAEQSPDFEPRRGGDGQTLYEFLRRAPFYYAPFFKEGEELTTAHIQAIDPDTPPFSSFLGGLDAQRILRDSLLEVAHTGVRSCRTLLERAEHEKQELRRRIASTREDLRDKAGFIAGSQFPIQEMLAIAIRAVEECRPRPLQYLGRITGGLAGAGVRVVARFRQFIRQQSELAQEERELRDRESLERERLQKSCELLTDHWRGTYPEEAGRLLSGERCARARQHFTAQALPSVHADWEEFVRQQTMTWARRHWILSNALSALKDALTLGGVAVVALDLTVAGGAGLGIVTAAGAGSVGAGLIVELFDRLRMGNVLRDADAEWREKRSLQIAQHLEQHFADPLFLGSWKERAGRLEAAPLPRCLAACDALMGLRTDDNSGS
jgi:energy-coupling factor transporter ATP-binding protein EcfA2